MEGGDFFSRVVAAGAVAVVNGVATLVAASGLTDSIVYNGLGDATISFRGSVLKLGIEDPDPLAINVVLTFIQIAEAKGFVSYTYPTTTSLRVKTFDTADAPADLSYQFLILSTQRKLV